MITERQATADGRIGGRSDGLLFQNPDLAGVTLPGEVKDHTHGCQCQRDNRQRDYDEV